MKTRTFIARCKVNGEFSYNCTVWARSLEEAYRCYVYTMPHFPVGNHPKFEFLNIEMDEIDQLKPTGPGELEDEVMGATFQQSLSGPQPKVYYIRYPKSE